MTAPRSSIEEQLIRGCVRSRSVRARAPRPRSSTAAIGGTSRRAPTATRRSRSRQASRFAHTMFSPAKPVQPRQHGARREALVALDDDAIHLQEGQRSDKRLACRATTSAIASSRMIFVSGRTSDRSRPRRRAGFTWARWNRLSAEMATGLMTGHLSAKREPTRRPAAGSADRPRRQSIPAPSVITTSPGRATRASAGGTSARFGHDVDASLRRVADFRCQALECNAGNRILAGCVDVREHDVIGGGERDPELACAVPPSASSGAAGRRR